MPSTRSDEQALDALRRLAHHGSRRLANRAGDAMRVWPMLSVEEKVRVFDRVIGEPKSANEVPAWFLAAGDELEAQSRLFL